jgi:hypothetical protein
MWRMAAPARTASLVEQAPPPVPVHRVPSLDESSSGQACSLPTDFQGREREDGKAGCKPVSRILNGSETGGGAWSTETAGGGCATTKAGRAVAVPVISPWLLRWFGAYTRRYLRKHFSSVWLSGEVPVLGDGPVIVFINHPSWWDPMISMHVARIFFATRPAFAPIGAQALKRYGLLSKLGFFPVEQGTRGDTAGGGGIPADERGHSAPARRDVVADATGTVSGSTPSSRDLPAGPWSSGFPSGKRHAAAAFVRLLSWS